jgi:hypothetical protein
MLQDLTAYDEGEGPDIDEETAPDQVNNELEIMGKCRHPGYLLTDSF